MRDKTKPVPTGQAAERPIHFQDVYATVCKTLGIDVCTATCNDLSVRPRYLIDNDRHGVIRELL